MRQDDKLRLAHALDECGFTELEVGMPAISPQEADTVRKICRAGLTAKSIVLCRAIRQDIDMAAEFGAFGVSISLPLGYLQLEYKLRWDVERVIQTAVELSSHAHEQGLHVTLSPYDTTRVVIADLVSYLQRVHAYGHADRVRLVDTVGCATPSAIAYLVKLMTAAAPIPIEVHCHDDFGLAVANTVAGVLAGAPAVSTTVNGIGERAGNAPTEEVVMALELLYGIHTGIDTARFFELSRLVEKLSGFVVQRNKAVVGDNAFAQEAGLVVGGFVRERFTAEPYAPELVGQVDHVLLGKKSGLQSISLKLAEMGIGALPERALAQLLEGVKAAAEVQRGSVTDAQFQAMVNELDSLASS
jgi:isopropylmalate/homocitrate/citramalate synthase